MSTNKLRRLLKEEFPFIASVEVCGSGHLRVRLPNNRSVFVSASPSCPFFLHKVRKDVRRSLRAA